AMSASLLWKTISDQHAHRVFDDALEGRKKFGPECAVDSTVVCRKCHCHHVPDLYLSFLHHRARLAGSHCQDGSMRRVYHRGEILDAEHAQIGDGCRAALI